MYKRGDSIALTKGLLIAARRLSGDGLALSVCFADTSPKGRGSGVSVRLSFVQPLRLVASSSPRPGCGSQRLLRGRLHPADRCPNSSSLFPPLAAVVAVAPEGEPLAGRATLC